MSFQHDIGRSGLVKFVAPDRSRLKFSAVIAPAKSFEIGEFSKVLIIVSGQRAIEEIVKLRLSVFIR